VSLAAKTLRRSQETRRRPSASRPWSPTSLSGPPRASTARPHYIRESPSWMVFDAGGDLFVYQFERDAARSEALDREPHYEMARR